LTVPGHDLDLRDYEALAACGIPYDLARQAMIRRVDSTEGAALMGRSNGAGDFAGLLFPYLWPGEDHVREYRLRRDHPDIEYADGRPRDKAKYLSPPGRGNQLYFVPGTEAAWLQDASIPLVVTEGEKKTAALWALGWHGLGEAAEIPRFVPMGLAGVWSWRGTTGKTAGPEGGRRAVKGPLPDLARIEWRRRNVTVLFDANVRANQQVQGARAALSAELRKRGAVVYWFAWPGDTPEGVNGIDDLLGQWEPARVLALVQQARPVKVTGEDQRAAAREFTALGEDRYRMALPTIGITFEVDRLRRDHHELVGELRVRCDVAGARTVNGTLSIADFNLSSARARSERARLLADRSKASDLDWGGLLEELCQRVLMADRAGQPAVDLRYLERPAADDAIRVEGLTFPRRHPSVIFGDGGTAKSYTALYLAGRMAEQGMAVGLFDWELAGDDHRERLERLFGLTMPRIVYARCERPLVFEADRLRRIVRENSIDFAIYDSVAFACDGPPEAAEVAGRYFRAVREIGCGSLHVAHTSKADNADKKPFGSVFWHNGARATWYVQVDAASAETDVLEVGFFNRKANLGRLAAPVAYSITFGADRTTFRPTEAADSPGLSGQLSVRQRMAYCVRGGAMSAGSIASEIEAEVGTVKRTARRYRSLFTVLQDGRIGLLERAAG